MMSTTSVIFNVPCKLNGSGSHCRSLENWFAAWDIIVWQPWLRMVGTLGMEPCPNFYGIILMRVIGDKNQISEDEFDFMISYLPFPQKSIRSELAKLFSISIYMVWAIDRSVWLIDPAALLMDPSLAQPSIDCASIDQSHCPINGWTCTIDHPWPSIHVCTAMHIDDWTEAEWLWFWWQGLCNFSVYV